MADQRKKKKVRGAGKCEKLYKRKREGHPPIELEWERGEPIRGPYISEFTGLVGFEVRSRVPITYHQWRDVPKDLKATVLDGVREIYVIPPGGARHVMTVAGARLHAFRTYLRKAYLTEGGDHYDNYPPDDYTFIEREHWEEFLIQMGTPEAKALSDKNRDIQKKNSYPHFMGRGGYAMLLRELAVGSQANTSHTPGRQAKVTDPALMEIRDRIVQLKKEVAAGTFVPNGHNDVLTRALGSAEHPGRTRGVGSYSGLRKVFNGNMKPRKPEGNYLTEDDLLQRLPSLLQQYGLSVSGSAPEGASMSQHTPSVPPHYELQRSSKASTDFVDVAGVTEVSPCYLRISDPSDYIVAHGSGRPLCRFCNKNSWLALLFWLGKPDFEPKLSGKFNIELGNLWDVLWADFVCGGLPFDGAAVLVRGGLLCAEMNLVLDSLRVCKLPCGCRGQVCVALWPAI
ncbi:unnamed protein product [Cuscuta campestris]|uniref:Uncharacterized protein n=1 Tax=Cuscuta campestris TaxID=132261 RepID=A0A484LT35_9ASTE|nr:unnamed protein product [Cuscuta campestris]